MRAKEYGVARGGGERPGQQADERCLALYVRIIARTVIVLANSVRRGTYTSKYASHRFSRTLVCRVAVTYRRDIRHMGRRPLRVHLRRRCVPGAMYTRLGES